MPLLNSLIILALIIVSRHLRDQHRETDKLKVQLFKLTASILLMQRNTPASFTIEKGTANFQANSN